MPKITLVTGHYWNSKRKAGFHWLANAYRNLGYEVLFFSAPISYLLKIKRDYRFKYDLQSEAGRLIEKEKNLFSYVHFTPWHVANFRLNLLNKITEPFLPIYGKYSYKQAEEFIKESEAVIFESSPSLFLFERFRELNKAANFIYRVSDDLRLLNVHPGLIKLEERILRKFDLVSVPSSYIYKVLAPYKPAKLQVDHHGINKHIYDQAFQSPYDKVTNLVFIGNDYFDVSFIEIASDLYKDYRFHIIGPISGLPKKDNIIAYGEMPFSETIPYVKHANAGLHTLSYTPGAESFTDSLKVLQYSYCNLPIVAPDFLKTSRNNTFCYQPKNKKSIKQAIKVALENKDIHKPNFEVKSWEDVASTLWDSAKS